VGVNFTVKVAACPGASVKGVVMPLTVNVAPLRPTDEMLRFAVPVFVTVRVLVLVVAVVTLPKARLLGLAVSVPTAAVVPLPDTATVVGEFVALLTKLIDPFAVPDVVGANFAV